MLDPPGGAIPPSPALVRALAAHPREMARLIGALHRRAVDAETLLDLMGRISREAVRLLDGVQWAGITARFTGPPLTASHTDSLVLIVDEHQYHEHDGPCLRAMRSGVVVAVTAAQFAHEWPRLADAASQVGVRAVLAVPLFAHDRSVGALNLYSAQDAVQEPDVDLLAVLTEYAGRGLADFQNSDPSPSPDEVLRRAVAEWTAVERAVGILRRRHGFDTGYASEVLVDQAEDWGRTVSEQAAHIINNAEPD